MKTKLIYDVGVCDGEDSAYYLMKADRVVGIEANYGACESLRARFAPEIAEGRYILLNVGIAEGGGELPFWVCDDQPEWSSFKREIASRNGAKHHRISVPTCSFADVIAEHGVPDFAKIDIEGHDGLCLRALTPETAPGHISVELAHEDGSSLDLLHRLGYRDFKVISQITLAPVEPLITEVIYALPTALKQRARRLDRRVRGLYNENGWRFKSGSSGPVGDMTRGRWVGLKRARSIWKFLHDIDKRYQAGGLAEWYDIHARLPARA